MTWLIWRQHRGELAGALVVLAVLGVFLLLHGVPMHQAYDKDAVARCHELIFEPGTAGRQCLEDLEKFDTALPRQFATWLPFLPMVAGMLIGAPLLAREYEQRTWQLAWTQGVTRARWLATKLGAVLAGVVAVSVVFALGTTWWFEPLSPQRFSPEKFNHAVLVFPMYVVVAVAIGILAGVVVRRTILAAAIVVGGYLAVRLPVEFLLRPRYREPLTTSDPAAAEQGWLIHDAEYGIGPDGNTLPGNTEAFRYHPSDRFWEFQFIEAAILLGITVVLLAITWRLVLGRRTPRGDRDEPALVEASPSGVSS
jgi:hypothetical protein